MNHRRLSPQVISSTLVLLLLVACSTPQPTPVPPTNTPTPVPPTPTLTPPPTPTLTPNPLDDLEVWDLVYICDSSSFGVPDKFAANIERDTGKTVRVHNRTAAELQALKVLQKLQENHDVGSIRDEIADAEVIVFFGNPRGDPDKGGVRGGVETCINSRSCRAPDDCTPEFYEPYVENLQVIYEEILALREGQPTIIRAVDFYNPLISEHRECGTEDACTHCWDTFNAAIRQAAESYNIPLVSVYDAFNGLNHNEDPREMGYISTDGRHTNKSGQQAIADLLSQEGYEPVMP